MPAFSLWQILDVALLRLRVAIAAALTWTKIHHFWMYAHVRERECRRLTFKGQFKDSHAFY